MLDNMEQSYHLICKECNSLYWSIEGFPKIQVCNDCKLKELRKIIELNKSGYAGILPNGNIVDRREHPTALPIQENKMFNVVKPKEL